MQLNITLWTQPAYHVGRRVLFLAEQLTESQFLELFSAGTAAMPMRDSCCLFTRDELKGNCVLKDWKLTPFKLQ